MFVTIIASNQFWTQNDNLNAPTAYTQFATSTRHWNVRNTFQSTIHSTATLNI